MKLFKYFTLTNIIYIFFKGKILVNRLENNTIYKFPFLEII
jgi:hypothetical protein